MCYFVEMNLTRKELGDRFQVPVPHDPRYMPGYFINAFTRPYLPVITGDDAKQIRFFRWGLIPFWVKNDETAQKISSGTFNARAESIWEKPAFRDAARKKRCLVPAHGFYEWYTTSHRKIPFYIRRKDNQPFAFAGLFDRWTNPVTGEIVHSFSIITTPANALLGKIHNTKKRMPAILSRNEEDQWIHEKLSREESEKLLRPLDPDQLEAWSISARIASRDHVPEDEHLLDKVAYPETKSLLDG